MWWLPSLLLVAAPLSYEEALQRAGTAPEPAAAREAALLQRDAIAAVSPLSDNPRIELNPGVRSYPAGEPGAPIGPELRVSLSQSFNLGTLPAARREVAKSEADFAAVQWSLLRRAARLEAAKAWLELWAAHASFHAAEEEAAQARELSKRIERAVTSGGATRIDAAGLRAFAAELHVQALDQEGRQFDAAAKLATVLGLADLPAPATELPELHVPETPAAKPLPSLLLDAQAQTEEALAKERAAQSATQLHLSLQGGQEWPNQWIASIGAGLTFPIFERGQKEQQTHRARALALRGAHTAASLAGAIEWKRALHEVHHTTEVLHAVAEHQLPAAEEAARLETARFERGESTLFELTALRRQAFAARLKLFNAKAQAIEARQYALELQSEGGPP